MGDRCYLQCYVRPKDAKKLAKIVDGVIQRWDTGNFNTVICEEFNNDDELYTAAKKRLVFYGYHSAGDNYAAKRFVSTGNGRLYIVKGIHEVGAFIPVVEVTGNKKELIRSIDEVMSCLATYRDIVKMAFPGVEEE